MERNLSLKFTGPAVEGGMPIRDLAAIVGPIEKRIQEMLPPASKSDESETADYSLKLTGVSAGSFVVALDLAGPEPGGLAGLEVDPIKELTAQIASGGGEMPRAARTLVEQLQARLPQGIETLEIGPAGSTDRATIARRVPDGGVADQRSAGRVVTFSGRLRAVDWGRQRAAVELPSTSPQARRYRVIELSFRDEDADLMQMLSRKMVQITGYTDRPDLPSRAHVELYEIAEAKDDRDGLWPSPRFRWPRDEDLIDSVDPYAFYDIFHEADADGE